MIFFGPYDKFSGPLDEHYSLLAKNIKITEKYYSALLRRKEKINDRIIASYKVWQKARDEAQNCEVKQTQLEEKIEKLQKIKGEITSVIALRKN